VGNVGRAFNEVVAAHEVQAYLEESYRTSQISSWYGLHVHEGSRRKLRGKYSIRMRTETLQSSGTRVGFH
jgi:hypothetical protein